MIKLQRGEKPNYLTKEMVQELTERFKVDKTDDVWKHKDIQLALLNSSSFKCAFCECELQISATYMEIEHFKHKNDYKDEVVEWENLIPSCKRCNTSKGQHDVGREPIINPYIIDPKEHLTQSGCRIYYKTELGEVTRDVLHLNDIRLMKPRFKAWNLVIDKIENIYEDMLVKNKLTWRDRNKVSNLLCFCQSDESYSAFTSTALHQSIEYPKVIEMLKKHGFWTDNLESLHQNSLKLILDKRQLKAP